jgi:hypothetical protein
MGISLKRDNTLQAGRFSVELQLTGLQLCGVKKVMNGISALELARQIGASYNAT